MSHANQREFIRSVKKRFPDHFNNTTVFDVGSLNINGCNRQFFTGAQYLGIDVGEGEGVDLVCPAEDFLDVFAGNPYDVAISTECFEHNPKWKEAFDAMIAVTKPGGLVIMTCAAPGRKEHGTSRRTPWASPLQVKGGWDYYHNIGKEEFLGKWDFDAIFDPWYCGEAQTDLRFWGVKK